MSYKPSPISESISPEFSISVQSISKMFPIFKSPKDRLKQQIHRSMQLYEEFWALKDISFDLKKGASLGILGHNGAGKSTLLQILAGTLSPTTGKVLLRGRVGAIMTMGSGFRQDFTGLENIYVLGSLMGVPRKEINRHVDRIKDFADIGMFFDKPIRTYSSGMIARLAFAAYTCLEPDILIVDEVINVGDAKFREKCSEHVAALIQKGMSLLLVSHSPLLVQQFCHQALVLEKGKLIYQGGVKDASQAYGRSQALKEIEA